MSYTSQRLKNLLIFAILILVGYILIFASSSFALRILLVSIALYILSVIFLAARITLLEKNLRYILFLPIVAVCFHIGYAIFWLSEIVVLFIIKWTDRLKIMRAQYKE